MTYIQPLLPLFVIISLLGLLRRLRWQKDRGLRILSAGILGIALVSWPPVAWLSSRPLEARYPRHAFPTGDVQAIVVLCGHVAPPVPQRPIPLANQFTYERCQYAAWLHHNWKPRPVLACGGPGSDGGSPCAATMRKILKGEEVPDSLIWEEGRSRSTYENAAYAAEILRRKGISRIALVTQASHMLRAEKCFRKQGFLVIPAPCGFSTFDLQWEEFLPGGNAVQQNDLVLHEALGLAWYWLRGWI
jgi:uncharacterized SAM-binding protein YcdF (DUF218 family)